MTAKARTFVDQDELLKCRLDRRLGPVHASQRLAIEREAEAGRPGKRPSRFSLKSLTNAPDFIRSCLKLSGLLARGQNNSRQLITMRNQFHLPNLPAAFEGFRILHLTDLHVDMDEANLEAVIQQIQPLDYDLCVLTGDYRQLTWGPVNSALEGMARLRNAIQGKAYAVLGNHDSIRMLPALEDMGYALLINEMAPIEIEDTRIYLAGVDDAHFYKAHNLHRAGHGIPSDGVRILLSHTPEIWREAAHAGYHVFLCGHTHGGQICLPGGIPVTLDSNCPRHLGRGYWQMNNMQGYTSAGAGTSVINVRLNCPPEVTIHTLTQHSTV